MEKRLNKMDPPISAGFDTHSAVTRSMLGWGILAGPIYLVTGLVLAMTRDGFRIHEHPLSLLMLGEHGWAQRANLLLSGVVCIVAAVGFRRAMNRVGESRWTPLLVGGFAVGLLGSGTFAPDAMGGFPPGAEESLSSAGMLHLAFGGLGFVCLGAAGFSAARWFARHEAHGPAKFARVSGGVILFGFVGGGALSQSPVGVALLWLAVLAGYLWLGLTAVYLWRVVPHPDAERR